MKRSVWRSLMRAVLALGLVSCREGGVVTQEAVPGGNAARGEQRIIAYGCGSCHVIPGVAAAQGLVGPPLTDFAARTFIAGRLQNQPVHLVRWIRDPQGVSPGTAMPDLGVTEQDARDMAAYLYTLGGPRLGPPHPLPERTLPGH